MKFIKVIDGKPYEVNGSPSFHHQSGWHFPNSSRVKDNGTVIEDVRVKKHILKQISSKEIQTHYKK